MKTMFKQLDNFAIELNRQAQIKQDYIASPNQIRMDNDARVMLDGLPFKTTRNADRQIADFTGIGTKYFDKMREDAPELLAQNVNHWMEHDNNADKLRMVRTMGDDCRALLSNSYRVLDNDFVAEMVLQMLHQSDTDYEFKSLAITDDAMHIKLISPKTESEVKLGDPVQFGLNISNSEIGRGQTKVLPGSFRLVCLNGMTHFKNDGKGFARSHVGSANNDIGGVQFSRETEHAALTHVAHEFKDTIKYLMSDKYRAEQLATMKDAANSTKSKNIANTMEKVTKLFTLGEGESESILTRLAADGDLTRWGFANAVTNLANDTESYTRANELETIGGKLLATPEKQWEKLAA